jgi:hypothetical protein
MILPMNMSEMLSAKGTNANEWILPVGRAPFTASLVFILSSYFAGVTVSFEE